MIRWVEYKIKYNANFYRNVDMDIKLAKEILDEKKELFEDWLKELEFRKEERK